MPEKKEPIRSGNRWVEGCVCRSQLMWTSKVIKFKTAKQLIRKPSVLSVFSLSMTPITLKNQFTSIFEH